MKITRRSFLAAGAAVTAPFMYHCHILEHEDNGMMGQYATR